MHYNISAVKSQEKIFMKYLFRIILLFVLLLPLSSEQFNFKNNTPQGFIFKPVYYVKIKAVDIQDAKGFKESYLIGESEKYGIVAIDFTFRSSSDGLFSKRVYSDIYFNGRKAKLTKKQIMQYTLSTRYLVKLKKDNIRESDFRNIETEEVNPVNLLLRNRYNVDFVLEIFGRAPFFFITLDPVIPGKIIFETITIDR